eukprot:15172815-Alexandrium_andersonii.AAC.1
MWTRGFLWGASGCGAQCHRTRRTVQSRVQCTMPPDSARNRSLRWGFPCSSSELRMRRTLPPDPNAPDSAH